MHFIFCVTHQPKITIDLPPTTVLIWLGDPGQAPKVGQYVLDVNQHYPDLMAWHSFLTGTSGTFAIGRFLRAEQKKFSDFDLITITSYRKFISQRAFGRTTASYPSMFFISQAEEVPSHSDWLSDPANYFCIANPRNIGNTFAQYFYNHKAADFLRYLAIAVELEFITDQECLELINYPMIIPGGAEGGTLPVNVFLTIIEQLETICLHFLERHRPVKLDAYHRRALSFCNERLGSYLLQKILHEIFENTIPQEVIGHMHTVDIGASEYSAGI